jgi:hypothetical protein
MGILGVILAGPLMNVPWHRLRNAYEKPLDNFVDESSAQEGARYDRVEREEATGRGAGVFVIGCVEDRMNRTHKLARGDHDDLSQRVAHQMRGVGNPALAQGATERAGQHHRHHPRGEKLRTFKTVDGAKMNAHS